MAFTIAPRNPHLLEFIPLCNPFPLSMAWIDYSLLMNRIFLRMMYCYSKNSTVISIVLLDSSVVKELSICSSCRERQGLWLFERSCPKGVGKQITGERRTAHSKEGLSSFLLTPLWSWRMLYISLSHYFFISTVDGVEVEDFDKYLQFTSFTSRNVVFCFLIKFHLKQN